MTSKRVVPDEYSALVKVFEDAAHQAAYGKGKERHASEGEAYEDQIICEVTRRLGSGYPLGQAVKKIYEAQRIGGEKGVAELLGAINYIAASVIVEKENVKLQEEAGKVLTERGAEIVNRLVGEQVAALEQNMFGRKTEAKEQKFNVGDAVEVCPLGVRDTWEPAVVIHVWDEGDETHYHVKFSDGVLQPCPASRVRPAPKKAEGVEELVVSPFDEDRMRESMPGIVPQDEPSDFDAPQTKEELYDRIVANNPAVFGRAHKPTGEELAEMAEGEGNG